MTSAENLSRLASVAITTLTHADSYPKDLQNLLTCPIGIGALNLGDETLIFNLITIYDETIGPFYVPIAQALSEEYPPFKRIEIVQSSSEFYLVIRGYLGEKT